MILPFDSLNIANNLDPDGLMLSLDAHLVTFYKKISKIQKDA